MLRRHAIRAAAAAALAVSLLAAGCGGAAPSQTTGSQPGQAAPGQQAAPAAKPLTKVSFQLPWLWAGYDAGFVIAQQKGYFKDAGLDVSIQPSTSSTVTAEAVAGGKFDYGFADAGNVATLISKGAPLKVLACLQQVTPVGLVYNPQYAPKSAADLKGKTILANNAGGPVNQQLDAVLARAGMKPTDVHKVIVSAQSEASEFAAHPDWYETTLVSSAYPAIVQVDPQAKFTSYADLGVNTLSLALVTTTDRMKNQPDQVRAFVAAALKGWQYAADHQQESLAALLKEQTTMNPAVAAKALEVALPLEHTKATKGKPLGWMADSDWKETLDVLHQYAGMEKILPLDSYYTNEFLPKS